MKVPETLSAIHNYLKKSPESAQWFRANSNARSTFACYLLCQEQLTDLQKQTIKAIVNIFETGRIAATMPR